MHQMQCVVSAAQVGGAFAVITDFKTHDMHDLRRTSNCSAVLLFARQHGIAFRPCSG